MLGLPRYHPVSHRIQNTASTHPGTVNQSTNPEVFITGYHPGSPNRALFNSALSVCTPEGFSVRRSVLAHTIPGSLPVWIERTRFHHCFNFFLCR